MTNNTTRDDTYDVEIKDTQKQTDSIEISGSASFSVLKLVDVEITAKYGHTWENTHEFTGTIHVVAVPGYRTSVSGQTPVLRVVGDFTVTMGNSLWHLLDVHFDTPDANAGGRYSIDTTKVPPGAQHSGPGAGPVVVSATGSVGIRQPTTPADRDLDDRDGPRREQQELTQ